MAGMHLAIIAIVLVLYAATTQQLSVRRTWKDDSLQEMLMNHLQVESNEGVQSPADGGGPIVTLPSGMIEGYYSDSVKVFKSIPYAKPPVNNLRWRDPIPLRDDEWDGIRNAKEDPPACPQNVEGQMRNVTLDLQEDCLYLNVYAPQSGTELPVMIWIYGGAFNEGWSGYYDGGYLAKNHDVVIVTLNYRLGALGFFVYEDYFHGNYGFLDQVAAMKWVNSNIHLFGGDPNEVTIFGESAGGMSVALHMTSNYSKPYFNKAIVQSDLFAIEYKNIEEAKEHGSVIAAQMGCPEPSCSPEFFRQLSWETILENQMKDTASVQTQVKASDISQTLLQWSPILDDDIITDQPLPMMMEGKMHDYPMIVGSVANEGNVFLYTLYPIPVPTPLFSLTAILTDFGFLCPAQYAAQLAIENHRRRIYLYDFAHIPSLGVVDEEYCECFACHGDEVPYVFHDENFVQTEREKVISAKIASYWTNFARTGDPNDSILPYWPMFTSSSDSIRNTMVFNSTYFKVEEYEKDTCNFWDELGPAYYY